MTTHLQRDLTELRQDILTMGGLVERAVRDSALALVQRRRDLARSVISADRVIDQMEVAIDDECLKILALHQPVAGDLRFITAVMKINNDLERIADLASNIAERALDVMDLPLLEAPLQFELMTETASQMLRVSLDALVDSDSNAAREIIKHDDLVDDINKNHFETIENSMRTDPGAVSAGMLLSSVSRNVERIADLATNIAQDVVFLVDAIDIRHWPLGSHQQIDTV